MNSNVEPDVVEQILTQLSSREQVSEAEWQDIWRTRYAIVFDQPPMQLGFQFDRLKYIAVLKLISASNELAKSQSWQIGSYRVPDWRLLFDFARWLQAQVTNESCRNAELRLRDLKPVVLAYLVSHAVHTNLRSPRFVDADGAFLEFCTKWNKIQLPTGCDPFDEAFSRGLREPIDLVHEVTGDSSVTTLASAAYHLQQMLGSKKPIVLSTARVGEKFGREGAAARQFGSRLIKAVKAAGVLVDMGNWSQTERRAKKYRFLLDSAEFIPPRHQGRVCA